MEDILIGTTDRTITVFIPDPASTDGSGKTGLAAADLTVSYTRVETDNDVTVTDVTSSLSDLSALTDAHTDWGLKEVSSTVAPGLYRLDIADAVFASGAWYAVVYVMVTTSAAAATPKAFRLVAYNALDGVRLGLTALPNAAADAAGGLPISDAGGLDLDARIGTDIPAILLDTAEIGVGGAGLTEAGGTGDHLTAINLPDQTMNITGNITGNLSGSVGSVTGAVGSVTGNVGGNVTGSVGSLATQAKADVNAEVDSAIADARLDELLAADSDIDGAAPPTVGSVVHELLSKTAGSFTYDQTTDSLEALRDRGDAAWTTATTVDLNADQSGVTVGTVNALGTQAKADVNAEVDASLETYHLDHLLAVAYDPASKPGAADALLNELVENDGGVARFTENALEQAPSGGSAPTAEEVADAVWDEARADHTTAGSFGQGVASVQGNVTGSVASVTGNVGGNVTGSIGSLAAQAKADVKAEADTALTDYDPPTRTEATADKDEILSEINDGVAIAAGGIQSTSFAAGAIDSAALAQSAGQEIADEVLNRDLAGGGSGNTRNVRNALRVLRNKVSDDGAGTVTIFTEDDSTTAWTAATTRDASLDPLKAVDPSGP